MKRFAVIRPDGTRIEGEPGINKEFALWTARDNDARLARYVQRNSTGNVSNARRAGYSFEEVSDA